MKMVYLAMALAGRVAAAPRRREGTGGGRVETLRESAVRSVTEKNGGFSGFHRPGTWPLVPPLFAHLPMLFPVFLASGVAGVIAPLSS